MDLEEITDQDWRRTNKSGDLCNSETTSPTFRDAVLVYVCSDEHTRDPLEYYYDNGMLTLERCVEIVDSALSHEELTLKFADRIADMFADTMDVVNKHISNHYADEDNLQRTVIAAKNLTLRFFNAMCKVRNQYDDKKLKVLFKPILKLGTIYPKMTPASIQSILEVMMGEGIVSFELLAHK